MQKYRKKSKQEHIGSIFCIYATDWASATETRTRGGGSTSLVAASFACLTAASHQACETRTAIATHKDLRLRSQQSTTYTHGSLRVATESQYTENQRYTVWFKNKASLHRKQGFF